MKSVHVHIVVKKERIQDFIQATVANAGQSLLEPGIARFDLLQEQEDPCRFLLVEVYRNDQAPIDHKSTPHYLRWREAVADMMAEPRRSVPYSPLFGQDV